MSSGNGTGTDDPVTSPRSRERLEHGVELALHAPSVHNTQPWRWRIGDDHVDLFADRERHLPDTDPDGRDLFISCGAALHHLRVALAGFGLASATTRFPDPENRDHIATVRIVPGRQDPADSSLYPALRRRRTDRRRYGPGEVRQATLASLRDRAAGLGATLQPVLHPDVRARLDAVLAEAADAQLFRPGYVAELLTWTRRYADSHDGVPAASVPHPATRRADSAGSPRDGSSSLRDTHPTAGSWSPSPRPVTRGRTRSLPARPPAPCCSPRPAPGWPPPR